MKLKALHIYENFGGKGYRVNAEFEGHGSKVAMPLGSDLGNAIVNLCMDQIVEQIQSVAQITALDLIRGPEQAAKEIEHHAGD